MFCRSDSISEDVEFEYDEELSENPNKHNKRQKISLTPSDSLINSIF